MKNLETVKQLTEKRNEIEAEIFKLEKKLKDENLPILYKEICNLLDGCGKGYVSGDYYAQSRYYSDIPGVKNIRLSGDRLHIKVTSPAGYMFPEQITVREKDLSIDFWVSRNFDDELDY
ncbi:hypothetical protein SAMN05443429_108100 [Cruoricaptor ignavus]|uniref:Uncharacterized protein n=1 Tax=Cruoricaptor ignavus TaxID=1118202 RepID=A0A1M6G8R5_9FLAO|nr:hypothetical protein [Cruoricaptor ignavus]SHJ06363.1 hypothetical protein SAMN05443429_108100 [Cruoricaptor ignavus]